MTSVADTPAEATPRTTGSRLASMPELWGATAMAFMWLAVLFSSIYGEDIVSVNGGGADSTTIPSGVFVALFACLASISVAKRAFRRDADAGTRR